MRKLDRSEALAFLSEGTRTGKFATVRPDGRPHVAPVWFVVEGEFVSFTTGKETVKARNVAHNPSAALVVDYESPPYGYVIVEGDAELVEDTAEARRVATLAGARYMGADRADEFGARNGVEGELVVRLRAERIIGRDEISE